MKKRIVSGRLYWGPVCIALGAALWGTETLWRVFLNKQFLPDVLVLIEHFYCLVFALPLFILFYKKLKGTTVRTWVFLFASGILGSAVGTVLFTAALGTVNLSVANVLLNIQPVFSAVFACFILHEHLQARFYLWAFIAVLAGSVLSLAQFSIHALAWSGNISLVFATALCWGLATVAGRGANLGMDYRIATPLRFVIGGLSSLAIVFLNRHLHRQYFHPALFLHWPVHQDFILLSVLSGVVPLLLYFKGLYSTPAAVAGFLELFQVVAALMITWGFFGQTLLPHQIIAACVLLFAVWRINRVQHRPAHLAVTLH